MPRLVLMLALVMGIACAESPTDPSGILPVPDLAEEWVGAYRGSGQGVIDGRTAVASDAALDIAFDSAGERLPSCPKCVTVRLDESFFLVNVSVQSRTELNLSYRDGVVLYTLRLERSPLGANPNLVEARLTIGNADAPTPIVDMQYLVERP